MNLTKKLFKNRVGASCLGLTLAMFASSQAQAVSKGGDDAPTAKAKVKIISQEVHAKIASLRAELGSAITKNAIKMSTTPATGAQASKLHAVDAARTGEAAATWNASASTVLASLDFPRDVQRSVFDTLSGDAQKWSYFTSVLSKLSPENLARFETDAQYRSSLLNVVNKFADMPVAGASKADDFANIVRDYDVATLDSLAGLRFGVGKNLVLRMKSFAANETEGSAVVGNMQKFLEDAGVTNAAALAGNFKSLVKEMHGDKATAEQVYALLRHGDQDAVKAVRQATFEVEAWQYVKGSNITRDEFNTLVNSCGLKA